MNESPTVGNTANRSLINALKKEGKKSGYNFKLWRNITALTNKINQIHTKNTILMKEACFCAQL